MLEDTIEHIDRLYNDNALMRAIEQLAAKLGSKNEFGNMKVDRALYDICFQGNARRLLPEAFGPRADDLWDTFALINTGSDRGLVPLPSRMAEFYRACHVIMGFFTLRPPTRFS